MFTSTNILLSGNEKAEEVLPTLINSVHQNTTGLLHVRILSHGWEVPYLERDNLRVECIPQPSPSQRATVFGAERLKLLGQMEDWDRCLVLGWDQLAVGNIDEYYRMGFKDSEALASVAYTGGQFRDLWPYKGKKKVLEELFPEVVLSHPGISGGSNLFHLDNYRKADLPAKMEHALKALGNEDHLAMIGVCLPHFVAVPRKWNVLCEYMHKERAKILHFNGSNKPWKHRNRKPVWDHYLASWEQLRTGDFSW